MSSYGNGMATIGVTAPAVTQAVVSTVEQEVVTPPPQRTTSSTTPPISQPISLGPRPTAAQQVTFPQVTREYPWGMLTSFTYEFILVLQHMLIILWQYFLHCIIIMLQVLLLIIIESCKPRQV